MVLRVLHDLHDFRLTPIYVCDNLITVPVPPFASEVELEIPQDGRSLLRVGCSCSCLNVPQIIFKSFSELRPR